VRLDNVVKLNEGMTAFRIEGLDRQRQVGIRANVAPGYGLADRLVEMFKAAEKLNMPAAYTTMVVGRGRELERTFGEFQWPSRFRLSSYMILASRFEPGASHHHSAQLAVGGALRIPLAVAL
jgi:HAE1 family hydrophobic/amphiphilic exporter-1